MQDFNIYGSLTEGLYTIHWGRNSTGHHAAIAEYHGAVVGSVELDTLHSDAWAPGKVTVEPPHQGAHLEEWLVLGLGEAVHKNYPQSLLTPIIH